MTWRGTCAPPPIRWRGKTYSFRACFHRCRNIGEGRRRRWNFANDGTCLNQLLLFAFIATGISLLFWFEFSDAVRDRCYFVGTWPLISTFCSDHIYINNIFDPTVRTILLLYYRSGFSTRTCSWISPSHHAIHVQ